MKNKTWVCDSGATHLDIAPCDCYHFSKDEYKISNIKCSTCGKRFGGWKNKEDACSKCLKKLILDTTDNRNI